MRSGFALALAIAAVGRSAPADERVTVPAPLGQQNKETVVQPSGTLKQAGYGFVEQGTPGPRGVRAPGPASPAPGDPGIVPAQMPATRAEPTGPAIVAASYLTIRGTVTGYARGTSVTILDSKGRTRTFGLRKGAAVVDGLKEGDAVAVRVPVEASGACKEADRVERQTAAPAALPSKFSQVRTAGN